MAYRSQFNSLFQNASVVDGGLPDTPEPARAGDELVAFLHAATAQQTPAWSLPDGWTLVPGVEVHGAAGGCIAATHRLAEGETGPFPFGIGVPASGRLVIVAMSGPNRRAPLCCGGAVATGSGATASVPEIAPALDGAELLYFIGASNTTTFAPPTGMTTRVDSGGSRPVLVADQSVSAGPTGARSAGLNPGRAWFAGLVALRSDAYSGTNPFGLMTPERGYGLGHTALDLLRQAGARWWRANNLRVDIPDDTSPALKVLSDLGYPTVVAIRNGAMPSKPLAGQPWLRDRVRAIVDRHHPRVLMVHNEGNDPVWYSGSADQMAADVEAVANIVSDYRGPIVVAGGLTFKGTGLVNMHHLYDLAVASGQLADADGCVRYANVIMAGIAADPMADLAAVGAYLDQPGQANLYTKTDAIFSHLLAAGAEKIDFHWYGGTGSDARAAIATSVEYLAGRYGLPVMCSEFGHRSTFDPTNVFDSMAAFAPLGPGPWIFYSIDIPKDNGAMSLWDPDGSPRPALTYYSNAVAGYDPVFETAVYGSGLAGVVALDAGSAGVVNRETGSAGVAA